MSSLLANPPRAGLVTESVLVADGFVEHTDSLLLVSESSILIVSDSVTTAGSALLVSEVVGNTIPRAGQSYNPNVITYPDSSGGIIVLVTESVGNAEDEGILAIDYHGGAGSKYGPQPTVGGGGGGGGAEYTHVQSSAAATWTVTHNLGLKPDVYLTSTGGIQVMGEIVHIDNNTLQVFFDIPFTGYARCT